MMNNVLTLSPEDKKRLEDTQRQNIKDSIKALEWRLREEKRKLKLVGKFCRTCDVYLLHVTAQKRGRCMSCITGKGGYVLLQTSVGKMWAPRRSTRT